MPYWTMDEIMSAKCEEITPLWLDTRKEIESSGDAGMHQLLQMHMDSFESRADWTDCEKTIRRKRLIIQWMVASGQLS